MNGDHPVDPPPVVRPPTQTNGAEQNGARPAAQPAASSPPPVQQPAQPVYVQPVQEQTKGGSKTLLWILVGGAAFFLFLLMGGVILYLAMRDPANEDKAPPPGKTAADKMFDAEQQVENEISKLKSELRSLDVEKDAQIYETEQLQKELDTIQRELDKLMDPTASTSWFQYNPIAAILFLSYEATADEPKKGTDEEKEDSASEEPKLSRIEELRLKREELEERIYSLKKQMVADKRRRETIVKQIALIKKVLADIYRFTRADLVILQPDNCTVGLKETSEGFDAIARTKGPYAAAADYFSYNKAIHRVRDNSLAVDLYENTELDKPISSDLVQRVKQHWKTREYVPSDVKEMVTFEDLKTKAHRIGYDRSNRGDQSHEADNIQFLSFGGEVEMVPRSHVTPGSAQRGLPKDLLDEDSQFDFIDYCILEVARKMSSPNKATHHRLAIRTKLDLSEGASTVSKNKGRQAINEFMKDNLSRPGSEAISFAAIRNALEDSLYSKITDMGVEVMEREEGYIGDMKFEQDIAPPSFKKHLGKREVEQGTILYATHVLYVEVADSLKPDHIRFSVRLNDAFTGKVLWAQDCDRPMYSVPRSQLHSVNRGKLVLLGKQMGGKSIPLSQPIKTNEENAFKSRLVILEGSQDDDTLQIRDLFDSSLISVPAEEVKKHGMTDVSSVEDVPIESQLRYIVWRLSTPLKPAAGRITYRHGNGVTMEINDAQSAFAIGDRLTACRLEKSVGLVSSRHRRLPLRLTVTTLSTDSAELATGDARTKILWSDPKDLAIGDIVMPPNAKPSLVAVENPVIVHPNAEIQRKLQLNKTYNRNRYIENRDGNADGIASRLRTALEKLDLKLVHGTSVEDIRNQGATHMIRANLLQDTMTSCDVQFSLTPIDNKIPLAEFQVNLKGHQIKTWIP